MKYQNPEPSNLNQSGQVSDESKNLSNAMDEKKENNNQFDNDTTNLNSQINNRQRKSTIVYQLKNAKTTEERASIALSIPIEELVKRYSLQPIHLQNRIITRDIAAKEEGILPISLGATQLSTIRHGNTCAYRSSGPVPTNLYMKYLSGDAEPK